MRGKGGTLSMGRSCVKWALLFAVSPYADEMQRILMTILLAGLLMGCASSRVMVSGKPRTSVRASDVQLLKAAPASFETIGTVSARSGGHGQIAINAATRALRWRAGRVGANAVILDNPKNNGVVLVSGFLDRHVRISGKAIYVTNDNATAP